MTELELLIRALLVGAAAWRLASLLVNEDGPLNVFFSLRLLVGLESDAAAPPEGVRGFFHALLSCVWCTSVWTAALFWFLPLELSAAGAAMAVAVLIHRATER